MFCVPTSCDRLFRDAGWLPGRWISTKVADDESNAAIDAGIQLVAEFGGLHVGKCGSGEECAASDIRFSTCETAVDSSTLVKLETLAGEKLFSFGSMHHDHGELFLDSRGRIYLYGNPDGILHLVGESFEDAVERVLLGRLPLRLVGKI